MARMSNSQENGIERSRHWLEENVNYAGEPLSFNDIMFLRMERGIKRLGELRARETAGEWLNRNIK